MNRNRSQMIGQVVPHRLLAVCLVPLTVVMNRDMFVKGGLAGEVLRTLGTGEGPGQPGIVTPPDMAAHRAVVAEKRDSGYVRYVERDLVCLGCSAVQ